MIAPLIILIVIYIVSGIAWYFSVRYDYKHNYKHITPDFTEVLVIFIPVINTIWSIMNWTKHLINNLDKRGKNERNKGDFSKFFGVKNK